MYKQGDTVDQDYHKTSIWTKKLAKKKDNVAQYNLGILYSGGLGVRRDDLEASKWFIFSSDQGNNNALCEMAEMKYCGHSFTENTKEAVDLYYRSAIGGSMDACTSLAQIYLDGDGIEQDCDRGLKMYDYAAKHGNPNAQYMLGSMYENGEYVEVDHLKAGQYYSMVSITDRFITDRFDRWFSLAAKFLNGNVLTRDSKKAYSLLKSAKEKMGRAGIFQVPMDYHLEITSYYNLIDMFVEVSEAGIDNLEYNIGYAFEHGIYSFTMDEMFAKNMKKTLKWYSASANKGDSRALYRLGLMHEEGRGTKKNTAIAIDYYRRASGKDNVDAKYRLGCMYLTGHHISQDRVKAFYLFTSASNMGHLKSRKALMLPDGTEEVNSNEDYLTQDEDVSFTEEYQIGMLEAMAERGLVAIQYQLGKYYQNRSDPKAIQWLTSAAQGGISDACYRLGVFYEEGTYTQQSYERAIELYETAAKGDHEDAIYRLAKLYQFGRGIPVNFVKTYDLYLRASEMGHLLSFKVLNIIGDPWQYSTDTAQEIVFDTTSPEYQQSLLMCEHVAEQGNIELQYKLGTVYEDYTTDPNYSKALKWYKMAASNSHREATYRLGLLYEKGLGIVQDHKEAIRLFRQAKVMNSNAAIFSLGRAYQYGYGVDVDPLKAIEYYTLAADLGNSQSQHTLGELYEKGEMVQPNILESLKLYTKAYSQGYDAARSNLFKMYIDIPYEVVFYKKLHKILQLIVSTQLPKYLENLDSSAYYHYHRACHRLGYWYYQQGEFERAWYCFSKSFSNTDIHRQDVDLIKTKYINAADRNDMLDKFQTQESLLDSMDTLVLYTLGMGYYGGAFEDSTEDGSMRDVQESEALGSENTKNRRNTILKQDYRKALVFLEKAAEKGHYGYGVKVNFGKAREWYDKAATDDAEYSNKVGLVYYCDGELQDFSKAVKYSERRGKNYYYVILGFRYLYGTGVEKDYNAAIELFNGLTHTLIPVFYLGFAYYNGPDDIRDYSRAFRLFQKVLIFKPNDRPKSVLGRFKNPSEHNISHDEYSFTLEPESAFQGEAYYYLGIMYKNGQGVAQNGRRAKNCFLNAVKYGNEQAKQYLE